MTLLKGSLIVVLLAASIVMAQTAGAEPILATFAEKMKPAVAAVADCKRETVQVQTQHNYREATSQALLKDYDDDKKAILDIAKKSSVTATIKSENYNINTANDYQFARDGGMAYTLSGSASYLVEPKEKAKDFFLTLTTNKIRASMNYSMNDNCNRNN